MPWFVGVDSSGVSVSSLMEMEMSVEDGMEVWGEAGKIQRCSG